MERSSISGSSSVLLLASLRLPDQPTKVPESRRRRFIAWFDVKTEFARAAELRAYCGECIVSDKVAFVETGVVGRAPHNNIAVK